MRPRRKQAFDQERQSVLVQMERWLEGPMSALGLLWLGLLIVELTQGLDPLLERAGQAIWAAFLAEFAVRFLLAPAKGAFLRRNTLTLLSLAAPALRVLRIARLARALRAGRAVRGLRLFRLVASLNRGMRAVSAVMGRRGLPYVLALTGVVTLAGAAGMYAFERDAGGGGGLDDYAAALWWTAMLMTTMGSDYWPQTPEGRLLCVALSLYAFGVFGYITAALASFFVARDAADKRGEVAGADAIRELRSEIVRLREELRGAAGR